MEFVVSYWVCAFVMCTLMGLNDVVLLFHFLKIEIENNLVSILNVNYILGNKMSFLKFTKY